MESSNQCISPVKKKKKESVRKNIGHVFSIHFLTAYTYTLINLVPLVTRSKWIVLYHKSRLLLNIVHENKLQFATRIVN